MIAPVLLSLLLVASPPDISKEIPAAYSIEVSLNDSTHILSGSEKISYLNPTSHNLTSIAFHLYPNAFKDTSTVYCREDADMRKRVEQGNVSKTDVYNIRIDDAAVEEDEYRIDGTRLYIDLEKPLSPGARIEISLDFETLIPRMMGHFGYDTDGDYLVAHCMPILCGYQKDRLIDREYHANSEFFSNFSYYDVILRLPGEFKAVSSGVLTKDSESDSMTEWHAVADTVIDFAFVCGQDYAEFESKSDSISLKYLIKERHKDLFPAVDSTVKNSLGYCGEQLFPYPYRVFSVAEIGFGQAGLELPGLIISGIFSYGGDIDDVMLKKTIAHETAHEWFYATVATNEFEEPWLDEGFASFMERKIALAYGFDAFPVFFSDYLVSDMSVTRFFALSEKARYPVDLKSWDYPDRQSYTAAVYGRGWMVLQVLENVLGDSTFAEALKNYAEEYRFRYPDRQDFLQIMSQSSSQNLDEFNRMFIEGTARVDYGIESARYEIVKPKADSGKTVYKIYVDVVREYGGILPQVVTVGLEDGTVIRKNWDGGERIKQFTIEAESIPVYVSIDKTISYALDENINNNSAYFKGHVTRMVSFEWDVIFIIEFLASIIL